mgnify:FL=1
MSHELSADTIDALAWDKQGGLLPAIVQDARTLRVLMLGYMDAAALRATMESGHVTFFSRSRNAQWTKGETSGHFLDVVTIDVDCDRDTLLVTARPHGPTCHLGRDSCFPEAPGSFVHELDAIVAGRERERPAGSYTTRLFEGGVRAVAQKVVGEGGETALAAGGQSGDGLRGVAGDLMYHLLVLLRARGLGLADVEALLRARHAR